MTETSYQLRREENIKYIQDRRLIVNQLISFMMMEAIVQMMLEETMENLPRFSGKRTEDVSKWLEEITNGFDLVGLDDSQKVRIIHTYLTGDARKWIMFNIVLLKTWSSFTVGIRKAFSASIRQQSGVLRVNDCQKRLDTMTQSVNTMIESFKIVEDSTIESFKATVLIKKEETAELVHNEKGEQEKEPVGFIQKEKGTRQLVEGANTTEDLNEKEEERVQVVQEVVQKEAENADAFIVTPLANDQLLNKIVNDNDRSSTTTVLQTNDNTYNVKQVLLNTIEIQQLITMIDMTRSRDIFGMCQDNGSIDSSTFLNGMANDSSLWCNLSSHVTPDWDWFRALTVP